MASPIIGLDHVRIASADFSADKDHYATLLGAQPAWEGAYEGQPAALFFSANVDVLLIDSAHATGLVGACFRVDRQDRMARRAKNLGLELKTDTTSHPLDGSPMLHLSGGSDSRGLAIAFVERQAPAPDMKGPGITALDHLVISSNDAPATAFLVGARLGLDMRMDLHRPAWGARLMFFRCGDLIIEVVQQFEDEGDRDLDQFFGLSWRVGDADTVQEQLAQRGYSVSPVRDGRKPGTRVFTLRDGTAGVATLLLEPVSA